MTNNGYTRLTKIERWRQFKRWTLDTSRRLNYLGGEVANRQTETICHYGIQWKTEQQSQINNSHSVVVYYSTQSRQSPMPDRSGLPPFHSGVMKIPLTNIWSLTTIIFFFWLQERLLLKFSGRIEVLHRERVYRSTKYVFWKCSRVIGSKINFSSKRRFNGFARIRYESLNPPTFVRPISTTISGYLLRAVRRKIRNEACLVHVTPAHTEMRRNVVPINQWARLIVQFLIARL